MGPNKEKIDALNDKMKELGIEKKDLEFKYIKSSGRGGQKVNKSSSAVFVKHLKTKISVKCGKERSLHLNKFLALRNLVNKIEIHMNGVKDEDLKKIEKIQKQKLTRKRKTRKKIAKNE